MWSKGDNVLLATPVTVGTASAPTPHGNYTIYLKVANRRRQSSPGAGYPMTYWMEFKPAYGLHWGFVKPYPSTHGCVRMPIDCRPQDFPVGRVGIADPHRLEASHGTRPSGKPFRSSTIASLPDPPMSYMLSPEFF